MTASGSASQRAPLRVEIAGCGESGDMVCLFLRPGLGEESTWLGGANPTIKTLPCLVPAACSIL